MADDQVQTLKEKFLDYFDQFARYAAENPKDFLLSCKMLIFFTFTGRTAAFILSF